MILVRLARWGLRSSLVRAWTTRSRRWLAVAAGFLVVHALGRRRAGRSAKGTG